MGTQVLTLVRRGDAPASCPCAGAGQQGSSGTLSRVFSAGPQLLGLRASLIAIEGHLVLSECQELMHAGELGFSGSELSSDTLDRVATKTSLRMAFVWNHVVESFSKGVGPLSCHGSVRTAIEMTWECHVLVSETWVFWLMGQHCPGGEQALRKWAHGFGPGHPSTAFHRTFYSISIVDTANPEHLEWKKSQGSKETLPAPSGPSHGCTVWCPLSMLGLPVC